ncbi:hypothetical protein OSJ57_17200 [Sphingomonas sp. HH69]
MSISIRISRACALIMAALSVGGAGAAQASSTTVYTYDALGRLIQASTTGTVNSGVQMSMTYDAADNRVNYQVIGSVSKVIVVPLNGLKVIPIPDN